MRLFFGGSFDPVHLGHLLVAVDVKEKLEARELIFIPAFQAPLKDTHMASPEDRLRMLELCVEGLEGFGVSDTEIRRGGISYTVDTAKELMNVYGERQSFIVGGDSFLSFHLWREPFEILRMARLVIVNREGENRERISAYIRKNFPWLREGEDYIILEVRRIDLSSTEVRNRLRQGKSIRWMVPREVEEYIRKRGLYVNL
ncbi:MAG: nicotinate (nicotinamide) nucleotide adenylyltransferase [Acidobacteria bacterium]|jgi:nicotinate-nucleotide adenylyltransferase|nr:MAG: nicotinate (nicotinamide) nucleotide adenylyltransferase [Acidobacteriota bacterium]